MKYRKLLTKCFTHKSNNTAHVAVAVVAGLAAGAIISILFAPDSGSGTRSTIGNKAKGVGDGIRDTYSSLKNRLTNSVEEIDEVVENEVPHYVQKTVKKRKSDIKDIIHDAHVDDHHNDQPIS